MRVKVLNLRIISITDTWGFNERLFLIYNSIIEKHKPDYYSFSNPNAFFIYFKSTMRKIIRSNLLIKEIINITPSYSEYFEDFRIGQADGKMICSLNLFGKIVEQPIGDAGNKVYENIIYHTG